MPSRRHLHWFKGFFSEITRASWLASFFHQRGLEGAAAHGCTGCESYNSKGCYSHRLLCNDAPWSWSTLKPWFWEESKRISLEIVSPMFTIKAVYYKSFAWGKSYWSSSCGTAFCMNSLSDTEEWKDSDSMFRTSNTAAPDERCSYGTVLLGPNHILMSGCQFLLPGFSFSQGCHRVESTRLLIFSYEYALRCMVMFHFHDSSISHCHQ